MGSVHTGNTVPVPSTGQLAGTLDHLRRLVGELIDRDVAVQFGKQQLTFAGAQSLRATLVLSVVATATEFGRALIGECQADAIALTAAPKADRGRTRPLIPASARRCRRGPRSARLRPASTASAATVSRDHHAGSRATSLCMCSHTPAACHARSRRYAVTPSPRAAGMACHPQPVSSL